MFRCDGIAAHGLTGNPGECGKGYGRPGMKNDGTKGAPDSTEVVMNGPGTNLSTPGMGR